MNSKGQNISATISNLSYSINPTASISNAILSDCAQLFSENYGVWSQKSGMEGKRVKMNLGKLKEQLIIDSNTCWLATATDNSTERIVGHAFFVIFPDESIQGDVLWITQLVVHKHYRNQRIATTLIEEAIKSASSSEKSKLRAIGIASSHPFAIKATTSASKSFLDFEFISKYCTSVIRSSKVPYLQGELVGTIFQNQNRDDEKADSTKTTRSLSSKLISNIRSRFEIDHSEPQLALRSCQDWKLGELEAGSEFIVLFEIR